ncbi:unnamed protein product [Rangifer tarandus platyrhynchus]|uniref:Uncharacterized protein n=2 Tax=Rangifer tarandus platyrhynchus TaxID=3082113 RepID=A0ABN8YSN2_RANTA|nr:unnamed protein product [Rangifer tarandus platyrhynchus]CAI9701917.1 unnamed protein product [Rangifer tarandus platyrhynchus]
MSKFLDFTLTLLQDPGIMGAEGYGRLEEWLHSQGSRDSDTRQPPKTSSATALEGVAGEPQRSALPAHHSLARGGGGEVAAGTRATRPASRRLARSPAASAPRSPRPAVPRTLREDHTVPSPLPGSVGPGAAEASLTSR